MISNDTICPLNNETCKVMCEWRGDDGVCVAHHMVEALESIAEDMHKIVTGPAWEGEMYN